MREVHPIWLDLLSCRIRPSRMPRTQYQTRALQQGHRGGAHLARSTSAYATRVHSSIAMWRSSKPGRPLPCPTREPVAR